DGDLAGREGLAGGGGRHALLRLLCGDAAEQVAFLGLAGDDDGAALAVEDAVPGVQAEAPLAGLDVLAVAGGAVCRGAGAHVAVELDGLGDALLGGGSPRDREGDPRETE